MYVPAPTTEARNPKVDSMVGFYVCEVRTTRAGNLKETAARLTAGIF